MTALEYINKAFDIGIDSDEITGKWFVDPLWELKMDANNYYSEEAGLYDMWNIMNAECERRNVKDSKLDYLVNIMYEIFTTRIDPMEKELNNEITKDMMEYLKNKADSNTNRQSTN